MNAAKLARELAYPFTEMPVLLAMLVFWLLGSLAAAAGLLGLWLAMIILPAFFRHVLYVLESRIHGRQSPPVGIELFNWAENFWSLFPLVLICGMFWSTFYLANNVSSLAAIGLGVVLVSIFPASMAILAVTRSPVESLNPVVLKNMIRSCSWDYAVTPVVVVIVELLILLVLAQVLPDFFIKLLHIYAFYLLFSLTGAIVYSKGIALDVRIPDAVEKTLDEQRTQLTAGRQNVVTHAYGFVSRGNRAGGLAHIQSYIEREPDQDEAYNWFFGEMLKWENSDAALFFGQTYLHRLLLQEDDARALKLMAQCFHANPKFKPAREDRAVARDLAERYHRDDLLELLR